MGKDFMVPCNPDKPEGGASQKGPNSSEVMKSSRENGAKDAR